MTQCSDPAVLPLPATPETTGGGCSCTEIANFGFSTLFLSELFSGVASISTTEYSLTNNSTTIATQNTEGRYQLFLDVANLQSGDVYNVFLRERVTAGGTQRQQLLAVLTGPTPPLWIQPVDMQLMHGWDFTMQRTAGADRAISWSIRRLGEAT